MTEKKITIKEFKSMIKLPGNLEKAFDDITQLSDIIEMTKDLVQDWIKTINDGEWDREGFIYYYDGVDWLKENMRAVTEKPERECKTIRDIIQAHYYKQRDDEVYELKTYLEKRLELQELS